MLYTDSYRYDNAAYRRIIIDMLGEAFVFGLGAWYGSGDFKKGCIAFLMWLILSFFLEVILAIFKR